MRIAIMQPYLFPYIGYWQLIHSVDTFVLLDDVNYICRGWMARNRYQCDGQERYFFFPVCKASQNKRICDTELLYDRDQRENLWKTFQYAYRHCENREVWKNNLKNMIMNRTQCFTGYAEYTIDTIDRLLGIKTQILRSSELRQKDHPGGFEGIIQICKILEADEYINPIGGVKLYNKELFQENGIRLYFLKTDFQHIGKQLMDEKLDLSIIDLLYRHDVSKIKSILGQYEWL